MNFEKVEIRQEHKEHYSVYFAAYNSVTNSANKGLEHRLALSLPIIIVTLGCIWLARLFEKASVLILCLRSL